MVDAATVRRRLAKGWSEHAARTTPSQNLPADLTTRRFGSLVPVRIVGRVGRPGERHVIWLCQCDCGQTSEVTANNLRNGSTKTCGCRLERLKRDGLTHGHVRGGRSSETYQSWVAMLARCYNSNTKKFSYYGGRGISVCAEWRESFSAFLADMGERPAKKTLDRVDPDGNYEPSNCRWATRLEQNRNTRRSRQKAS